MKMNDPFGRVSKRDRRDYASLRDRLQQEGIRDSRAVDGLIANMNATATKLLLLLFGISLVLGVFLPSIRIGLAGTVALLLLWATVVYVKTRMHLKRYAREECDGT